MIRIEKCHQVGKHMLIWRVQSQALEPKKQYLIMDVRQESSGFKITPDKPNEKSAPTGIAALCRKHLPAGTLVGYFVFGGEPYLVVKRGPAANSETWLFTINTDRPPALALISVDQSKSLFRMSQKGIYTVAKPSSSLPPAEMLDGSGFDIRLLQGPAAEQRVEKPKQVQEAVPEHIRVARDKLKRKLRTLKKSLAKEQGRLPSSVQIDVLSAQAHALSQFGYLIPTPVPAQVTLKAADTGLPGDHHLELDVEKTVGQNIELLFRSLKRQRATLEHGKERVLALAAEIAALELQLDKLRAGDIDGLVADELLHRFKIKKPVKVVAGEPQATFFRTYQLADGARALVGKSASDNDRLTKSASGNDYWFHTIVVSGSHVIVSQKSLPKGQPIPDKVKRQAAILALHNSKLRMDRQGEVYCARRHDLKKKKNLPPGKWIVERSETVYIKYDQQELSEILQASGP